MPAVAARGGRAVGLSRRSSPGARGRAVTTLRRDGPPKPVELGSGDSVARVLTTTGRNVSWTVKVMTSYVISVLS